MSVTNGERLATKQDLADMYQGILPYLGGMPEMLANKFSKGDLYDTSEKMIGKWIDGKPLYQRVFVFENEVSIGTSSWFTSDIPITGIDHVIDSFGVNYANNQSIPLLCQCKSSESAYLLFLVSRYSPNAMNVKGIVVQYTKTTDSANSFNIGEATDYSTEEKIVGTWITGEPIYQKTWTGQTTTGTEVDLFSLTGANKIIDINGYLHNNGYYFHFNYAQGTGNYFSIFANDNVIKLRKQVNTDYDYAITVQYTKTTGT